MYKKGHKPTSSRKKVSQQTKDSASALLKQTGESYVAQKFVSGGDPFC